MLRPNRLAGTESTQGADERLKRVPHHGNGSGVLMVGGLGYGREKFVQQMHNSKFDGGFSHVQKGLYREQLAEVVASAEIVVAPPSPVTDHYWSNRVYNMLGLGAFLLHPYSKGLEQQYNQETVPRLVMYRSISEISSALAAFNPSDQRFVAGWGHTHTMLHHTYRHRCRELITICKEKLNV